MENEIEMPWVYTFTERLVKQADAEAWKRFFCKDIANLLVSDTEHYKEYLSPRDLKEALLEMAALIEVTK